jgi:5-methylcytosine-specific restriction endonuclease McrA
MRTYQQCSDQSLLDRLDSVAARDRHTTAEMIGLIAEVDARRLYAGPGYCSMFDYCVRKLRFSEDMACKRISAARMTRRFPRIIPAIAEGRLHLSGVVMLGKYLTQENAAEFLTAAEGKTRKEIEALIAERFPRADLPSRIVELREPSIASLRAESPQVVDSSSAPGRMEVQVLSGAQALGLELQSAHMLQAESAVTPAPASSPTPDTSDVVASYTLPPIERRGRVTPLAPKRHGVQVTLGQSAIDMLDQIKALLSHRVPSGDLEQVLEHTFAAAIVELERRKHAAVRRPRRPRQLSAGSRTIPAHVIRVVAKRDGGRCAHVGSSGVRCESRAFLEYDHIVPIAMGGHSTADNVRQLCRAHNQLEAERVFGRDFMDAKRDGNRRATG